jgi:hypothetical protein
MKFLTAPHIVALSEPYSDGQKWLYVFGDEKSFEMRTFRDTESAFGSYRVTLGALRMGSPKVSIKIIELERIPIM